VEPRPPGATAGPPGTPRTLKRRASRNARPPSQDHERCRLEGVRSLAHRLERHRDELQALQLSEMIFHGPNHDAYHDVARQLRAVVGSGLAQSKRVLNQTADVLDSFIAHGTGLRCRSFGSQFHRCRGSTAARAGTVELPSCWRYLRSTGRGSRGTTTFATSSSNMCILSAGRSSRGPRAGSRCLDSTRPRTAPIHSLTASWIPGPDGFD